MAVGGRMGESCRAVSRSDRGVGRGTGIMAR